MTVTEKSVGLINKAVLQVSIAKASSIQHSISICVYKSKVNWTRQWDTLFQTWYQILGAHPKTPRPLFLSTLSIDGSLWGRSNNNIQNTGAANARHYRKWEMVFPPYENVHDFPFTLEQNWDRLQFSMRKRERERRKRERQRQREQEGPHSSHNASGTHLGCAGPSFQSQLHYPGESHNHNCNRFSGAGFCHLSCWSCSTSY